MHPDKTLCVMTGIATGCSGDVLTVFTPRYGSIMAAAATACNFGMIHFCCGCPATGGMATLTDRGAGQM